MAIIIQFSSLFVTIHAQLIFLLGLYFSLFDKNTSRIMPVLFYIVGSELLWRGFGANIFWEYAKYSTMIIILISITRVGLNKMKNKVGFYILLLLLPSFLILTEFNRQAVSHSMSGPFLLGVSILFFSNQIITKGILAKQLISLSLPIITLLSLMLISTFKFGEFDVYAAYVKEYTTAGVGPNQASNILGLGVLAIFLLYVIKRNYLFIYLILGLLMLFQTTITHSRGGFWNTLIAISFSIIFLLNRKKDRLKFLAGFITICLGLYFFIFPLLNDLSKGSITNRYADTNLSHRQNIIQTEIRAFNDNPILGIGPGNSRTYRLENFDSKKHTHTEYSRLLSEHGLFGALVIIMLLITVIKSFNKNKDLSRSISLSLSIWSLLFMFHSATRLAAPSIIFGISTANFILNKKNEISR